jgi:hypothetical protein
MGSMLSEILRIQHNNLEIYSLVWFDTQIDTIDQQKLRSIINHLKIFTDQKQCQQYITSLASQDRVILIVNGQSSQELVQHIHQLRQLSSIYVYGLNTRVNEQWAQHYTKVCYFILYNNQIYFI